tara:strand:+ start:645 stop:887 length:243 start_codon:yes stop_codon:yes gene_type:complete
MKLLLLSIALISTFFFSGLSGLNALTPGWSPPDDYREDNSPETVIEPSDEDQENEGLNDQMSLEDIFGSEQVFPFEPGFS